MSIELRTGRNGKLHSTGYGRYEVTGKRYVINLGVKGAGSAPASLSLRDERETRLVSHWPSNRKSCGEWRGCSRWPIRLGHG